MEVGVVDLVVLDRVLRVMNKKRSSTCLRKKCTPQKKSWLCLCWQYCGCGEHSN